jgi:O-antigen/teichoic acid export membrane protein
MSDLKKLYWESSHYLAGRVVLMLLGFVSFPVFTRVFSVSDYGIMSLVLNTIMVLVAFSKFGMQNAVQRFYPEYAKSEDPTAFQRYYSTLFFGAGMIGGLTALAYVVTVLVLPDRLMNPYLKLGSILASALIVIRALRSMQTNLMQIERKTIHLNVSEIVNKAGTIGMVILLIFAWERGIKSFFIGTLVFEAIVVLAYVPSLLKRNLLSSSAFDTKFFRMVVSFSVPLMLGELAWLALDTGDRFLIQHFIGTEAVGYYAASYNVAYYVQDLVTVPLNLALFPIFMKLWSTEGESAAAGLLSRSLNHFAMGSVLIVSTFTVVSRDLLVLLASKKYESAHVLLPWLVSGLVLSACQIFFRPGLLVRKLGSEIAKATFYAAVVNVVLNVLMLPRIGVKGAAIATLLSYLVWIFLMARRSLAAVPFKLNLTAVFRYLVAGLAVVLIVSRIQINVLILSVVTKGLCAVAIYAGVLWIIDGGFRELVQSAVSYLANLGQPVGRMHSVEMTVKE